MENFRVVQNSKISEDCDSSDFSKGA